MSAQKQQQQQGSTSKRELEADFLFNQHIVRTVGYTAAGFGFGLATSLLFKHKAGMTVFFSGAGAGYGASNFFNDLNHFRQYKSLGQSQGQYQRQSQGFEQLERKGAQLGQGLENAKNQAKGAAEQVQNKLSQGAQNLKEQGRDVAGQAKNAGEQAYNKASEGLQNAKEQAKNVAGQAKGAAEHAQNKASEGLQNVKEQAKNVAGQAKGAAENLQNKASEGLQNAKEQVKNVAGQAKGAAEHAQNKASEGLQNAKEQAKNVAGQAKGAAEHVQNKASEGANKAKESAKDAKEQAQRRIDETMPNIKEQGKDTAGGTSRNAGGDPYNRASKEESQRNQQLAERVAHQQQAKNTQAHGSGTTAQGDHNKDATENVKGQTFQSFDSNSHKEGKAGMIHEIQTNYQENRNRFREQAASGDRKNLSSQGQDPYFKSETEGIGRVNEEKSETQMGAHGYKKGATETLKTNKQTAEM